MFSLMKAAKQVFSRYGYKSLLSELPFLQMIFKSMIAGKMKLRRAKINVAMNQGR